jgi:L-ascorbate metabolism protein UlaG (beta-lactamase superfamily)
MPVRVCWYGHAFFLLGDSAGKKVALDPFDSTYFEYPVPRGVTADLVLVTHEHADHNNVALIGGEPRVLRGPQGVGDHDFGFCRVRGVAAFHDEEKGRKRGPNTIYRLELGGLSWVHVGDLGHLPSAGQVTALQPVDVLFAALGGHFTLDPSRVDALVEALAPRLVVGMHYKTRYTPKSPLATEEDYVRGKSGVRRLLTPEFELSPETLPTQVQIWLPGLP